MTNHNSQIKRITVDSVEEFYQAIGPNTIIYLEPGVYKLDELQEGDRTNPYAAMGQERDGSLPEGGELMIHDINNLLITGIGEKPAEILTKFQQANVISFQNTHNVKLSNVRTGHWPDEGGCTGGVAVFRSSSDVNIDKCSFFGCGINGLEMRNVKDVTVTDSVIEDCNFHIMCIGNSLNIKFERCDFRDNEGTTLFNISGCRDVEFYDCNITGNTGKTDTGVLFNIDGGFSEYVPSFEKNKNDSNIVVRNSSITNNSTVSSHISRSPVDANDRLEFENTVFEGNSFDTPVKN